MKRYRVVWTEIALRDIERLAARLYEDAPLRAERVLDRIISRGDSLARLSHRGRKPPELRAIHDRTWLEVVETPWRIVYRVIGSSVEIHAVLDGRRDLHDLLLERMLEDD